MSHPLEVLRALQANSKYEGLVLLGEMEALDVPRQSSGILSLDLVLGGGYPLGRIVEVYGENSTAKTTIALHAIASVQDAGNGAAFIDAEHALDPIYAARIGVNLNELLFNQPMSAEEALNLCGDLAKNMKNGDIVVVDSVSALTPQAELNGEIGDAHMGLQARLMSQAMRMLTSSVSKSGVILLFINQTRTNLGISFGNKNTTSGGNALRFYASQRIDVRRAAGVKVGDDVIGHELVLQCVKNKVAPPFRKCKTQVEYGLGVPRARDVLLLAIDRKVVKKKGTWLSYGDENIGQGFEKTVEFLRNNKEVLTLIEKDILA